MRSCSRDIPSVQVYIYILTAYLLFSALLPCFTLPDYINFIIITIIKYFPLNTLKVRNVFNVRAHLNSLTFFPCSSIHCCRKQSFILFFPAFYSISVLKELILNAKPQWHMKVFVKPAVYSHYWIPFQLSAVCLCLLAAPINNARASVFCWRAQ